MYMMTPNFLALPPNIQGLFMGHANNHDVYMKREAQQRQPPVQIGPDGEPMAMGPGGQPMAAPGIQARDNEAEVMAQMLANESRSRVQGG
jgi:hypothetical protein